MRLNIIFVPTAGGVTIPVMAGKELPFWCGWPIFRWLIKWFGARFYPLPILKLETIARCKAAAQVFLNSQDYSGNTCVYASGGALEQREFSIVHLMTMHLIGFGVSYDYILFDNDPVQTTEKIEGLIKSAGIILKNWKKFSSVRIVVVASWYYGFRIRKEIERWNELYNVPLEVEIVKVFPPLNWECLKREYIFNILFEIPKLISSLSKRFLIWFGRKERMHRGL